MKNSAVHSSLQYQPSNVNEAEQPLPGSQFPNKPANLNQMNSGPIL